MNSKRDGESHWSHDFRTATLGGVAVLAGIAVSAAASSMSPNFSISVFV